MNHGVVLSVNIPYSSEPEKPVSVWLLELSPLLGNSIVTVEFL
jgi:hypothetical protein